MHTYSMCTHTHAQTKARPSNFQKQNTKLVSEAEPTCILLSWTLQYCVDQRNQWKQVVIQPGLLPVLLTSTLATTLMRNSWRTVTNSLDNKGSCHKFVNHRPTPTSCELDFFSPDHHGPCQIIHQGTWALLSPYIKTACSWSLKIYCSLIFWKKLISIC